MSAQLQLAATTNVRLTAITVPPWQQHPHRTEPEEEHVEVLALEMQAHKTTPITLWGKNASTGELVLVDGRVRLRAAERLERATIDAAIYTGYPDARAAWVDAILRNASKHHPQITRAEAALRLIDHELDPHPAYRRYRANYPSGIAAAAELIRAATRQPDPDLDPIALGFGQNLTAADLPMALERLLRRARSNWGSVPSFAANALPLITPNNSLRGLQRTREMPPSHATAIARIEDRDLQERLIDKYFEEEAEFTARELRRYADHANKHGNLDLPASAHLSDQAIAKNLAPTLGAYDQLPAAIQRRIRQPMRDLQAALQEAEAT